MGGNSGGGATVGRGGKTIGSRLRKIGPHGGPIFAPPEDRVGNPGMRSGGEGNYLSTRFETAEGIGNVLEVQGSNLDEHQRGEGFGTGMYIAMLKDAQRGNHGVISDRRDLSKSATRVWEGLRARLPKGAMTRTTIDSWGGAGPEIAHFQISSESLIDLGRNFNWSSLESSPRKRRRA